MQLAMLAQASFHTATCRRCWFLRSKVNICMCHANINRITCKMDGNES
jgi:hypothetical protein